jgi:DNA-directed RNA polymerase subunit F
MSNYSIIAQEAISGVEAQDILKKKEKERDELTYREEKSLEYLKTTVQLKKKDFADAKKELLALEIPRLEEEHILKILELMPKNGTELRAIVSHSGTVLVNESVDSILEVLKKY